MRVGSVSLRQLWPAERLLGSDVYWTDASPQWFTGARFKFAQGDLIYQPESGAPVTIRLAGPTVVRR